jgi:hypothetical protein
MSISQSIYWFWTFLKDKLVEAVFYFTKSDELRSYVNCKEYCENFLNDFNHQERIENIWSPLLHEKLHLNKDEIDKIYRLNFTYRSDSSLKKIEYYLRNRFWSSLDLFEINTFYWSHEEVFETPSLITYLIIKKDKSCLIVLASLQKQKYTLLKTYEIKKLSLRKFRGRQLVFSTENGFLTI